MLPDSAQPDPLRELCGRLALQNPPGSLKFTSESIRVHSILFSLQQPLRGLDQALSIDVVVFQVPDILSEPSEGCTVRALGRRSGKRARACLTRSF